MPLFRMVADLTFEAANIDEALLYLAEHFKILYEKGTDGNGLDNMFVPPSRIDIQRVESSDNELRDHSARH